MPSIVSKNNINKKKKNNINSNKLRKNEKKKVDLKEEYNNTDELPRKKVKENVVQKPSITTKTNSKTNRKEKKLANTTNSNNEVPIPKNSKSLNKKSKSNHKDKELNSKNKPKKIKSKKSKSKVTEIKDNLISKITQLAPIIINIDNNTVTNTPDYPKEDIERYTDKKMYKEDTRIYSKFSFFDEEENYVDKLVGKYNDIIIDFHSKSLDIKKIMVLDKDNTPKVIKDRKDPIDIDKIKESVEHTADELAQNDIEDFFEDTVFEEYIPISSIMNQETVPPTDKKDIESSAPIEDIYDKLLLDFKSNILSDSTGDTPNDLNNPLPYVENDSFDNSNKLTFGNELAEIYIDDTPILKEEEYQDTLNIDSDLLTLDNLEIEIDDEGGIL